MSRKELHLKCSTFIKPVHTIVHIDQKVGEALEAIRNNHIEEKIFYFYVVDDASCLKGIVSTRKLLLSQPDVAIKDIFEKSVVSITAGHTLQDAVEMLTKHRLLAIPVVNEENRLLGIIDIQLYLEEAVDVAQARRSATDLFQVLGLKIEEGKRRSSWQVYRLRMPWIFCNMFGGIACAVISRIFDLVLAKVLLLAMFIPLVLTLSESISMQSMTYSLQILHRSKISLRRIFYQIFTEWKMSSLLAITSGIIVGCLSLLWGEGSLPAFVIACGIMASVTISGIMGATIPLVLHAQKLDPKVAAGPVVLMLADIITTAIYLALATWILV